MKKKILKLCFKPLTLVNKMIRKDEKLIFFYSNLGFRDNVRGFYDYLIENNYNEKYRIVVSVNDYKDYCADAPKNVSFIGNSKGIGTYMKAKYAFYCFGKYPIKPSKNQMVVNLWHGMPLKKIGNMEQGLEKVDYNYFTKIVATSELFVPILMKSFSCDKSQVIITGQPRNDEMFKENIKQDNEIRKGAKKVILWLPTYRDGIKEHPTPIMDEENTNRLNGILKENNARLIIKIHPLQQMAGEIKEYSNIEILTQNELNRRGISVYGLLRVADGLISDYSSVYFDYMMLNRPLAFSVNDIEEYAADRGFVFENPYEYMPGSILKNYEEAENFICDVLEDRDIYKETREKLNEKINKYNDGKSGKRIANFVFGEA